MGVGVDQSADRERAVRWFRELAAQFDKCLEFARQEFGNIQFLVDRSTTADDLQTFLKPEVLSGFAGQSESYSDLFAGLAPGQPLTERILAQLCGFYLIPAAAYHVIDAVHARLLTEPLALCRPLELPGSGPALDDSARLRAFWHSFVLPQLKATDSACFHLDPNDPWAAASENAAAFRLFAELIEGAEGPAQDESPSTTNTTHEVPSPNTGISSTLTQSAKPDLIESDERVAAYIREHPGCLGKEIAIAAGISFEHFRRSMVPKLKKLGFFNKKPGYFPPPADAQS